MHSAIPLTTEQERPTHLVRRGSAPTRSERDPFSRAWHYALLLVPVALGVGFVLMRDYLAGPIPGGEALYTGIIRNVPGQDSLGVRIVTYLIFLLGLGTPLALLYAVGRVEDWESQTQDK